MSSFSRRKPGFAALLFAVSLSPLCSCSQSEELPVSGVFITLDTTNASSLDIYGKDRGLTPEISKLAEEGLTFDRAYTTAPITLPAHTSMMTGLYPLRHGVRDNGLMELSPDAETLAERAREAGYQTAAFISAQVLSKTYGLDQGFDVYNGPPAGKKRPGAAVSELRSHEVTDAAIRWLETRDKQRPFFLWVHYFDPHAPYDPPPKFLKLSKGNNYLGEVAAMDVDVGRLLDALDEQVQSDKLMLALVADHGESHERHGEPTHAAFCYEPTTRVPYILRFPDGRRAGERDSDIVSVVDLFPTFLHELGLGTAMDVDGLNLSVVEVPADRGVYMESYYGHLNFGWSPLAGWVNANGKYLHSSKPEFYDLGVDPKESQNLFGTPETNIHSHVKAIEELSRKSRLSSSSHVQLSEEQLAELRSLGYAAAGNPEGGDPPSPLDPSSGMAPLDGAATYADFSLASFLVQNEELDKAVPLLQKILEQHPTNTAALETLGGVLLEQGKYKEAIQYLELAIENTPGRFASHLSLAGANEGLGQYEETLRHLKAAQANRPNVSAFATEIERIRKKL